MSTGEHAAVVTGSYQPATGAHRRVRPWVLVLLRWLARAALVVLLGGVLLVATAWRAFGKRPVGERLQRMEASAQWDGGGFENPQPLRNDAWGMVTGATEGSKYAAPSGAVPVEAVSGARFRTAPATGLRVTWLGHSTQLIEIDGLRILTDPVWGPRASPWSYLGPERWYDPPLPLDELPTLDAVVISHDHYDHLDMPTITALAATNTKFLVPLGVGAHLEYWGVAPERIVEMDWWERHRIGEAEIVCTPARHASGRMGIDQDRTLWAGWAVLGPEHRAFFSGDTGLFDGMREIGARLGPFDVTMVEVGAYDRSWPDWHIGPEQAVLAHQWLRGDVFLPVHWGLFDLALHGWTEPAERTVAAAEAAGVRYAIPKPGQSIEPTEPMTLTKWWPEVPWRTAEEHPIVSTAVTR